MLQFSSFWIYPLLGVILFYLAALLEPGRRPGGLLWCSLLGLLIWTVLEYFLHRMFHWNSGIRKVDQLFRKIHLHHHAEPRNRDRILVRPIFTLPISGLLFGLLYWASRSVYWAAAVMVGIWMGFLYYEWVHYRVHLSSTESRLLRRQRRLHFYHHFVDGRNCFGVTSPLWDMICGTFRATKPTDETSDFITPNT